MARDLISTSSNDLMKGGDSILMSLVMGEQLELPVLLDMVAVANSDFTYEAVVIEGLNLGDGEKPISVQPTGVETTLTTRQTTYLGDWVAATAYFAEDVVDYEGDEYRLIAGTARVSSTPPDSDSSWILHDKRILYIQIPSTLGQGYNVQPTPDSPIYGFFELRVTELASTTGFLNTWKPVRGLIQLLFSPTDLI